jgi:predicted esterase
LSLLIQTLQAIFGFSQGAAMAEFVAAMVDLYLIFKNIQH